MIFVQLPIIVLALINLIFTILFLVFSGDLFGFGWPNEYWCTDYADPYQRDPRCMDLKLVITILVAIGGGLGFLVG